MTSEVASSRISITRRILLVLHNNYNRHKQITCSLASVTRKHRGPAGYWLPIRTVHFDILKKICAEMNKANRLTMIYSCFENRVISGCGIENVVKAHSGFVAVKSNCWLMSFGWREVPIRNRSTSNQTQSESCFELLYDFIWSSRYFIADWIGKLGSDVNC